MDVDRDTNSLTYEDGASARAERPCTACHRQANDRLSPDPCLGLLPGVSAACCGHGFAASAYLQIDHGAVLTGDAMLARLHQLGVEIPAWVENDDPPLVDQLTARTNVWLRDLADSVDPLRVMSERATDGFAAFSAAFDSEA